MQDHVRVELDPEEDPTVQGHLNEAKKEAPNIAFDNQINANKPRHGSYPFNR